MLHKAVVARVVWNSAKRKLRIALGLKPRRRIWPENGFDFVLGHHTDLVRRFQEAVPADWEFTGRTVCEVGCSDCLAVASLVIGKRAHRVELVEPSPCVINPLQLNILESIKQAGFALDTSILRHGTCVELDPKKVVYHQCFMNSINVESRYDYLYSFDVMEHVENLEEFYNACRKALKPSGRMFHSIDFSGHDRFEDPVPPLDFQTYPEWLHDLMYPPFYRATRAFLSDHQFAMTRAGFVIDGTRVLRKADPLYLDDVWPRLRPTARALPREEVGVLQAVIASHPR